MIKGMFDRFKKTPKTELYVQVVGAETQNTDNLIFNKIGQGEEKVVLNIMDLPENVYKCNAYKITIEPIEHTFSNPCESWKKSYKPDVVDVEAHKDRMKKMFGVVEPEEMIEIE